jgi:superfamily II DNA/RNA helicase
MENTWDVLKLKDEVLRGVYAYGLERPSKIQMETYNPIINGKDLLAQSQSGSGKTLAYCLPLLNMVNTDNNETQSLILLPTRELVTQVYEVLESVSVKIEKIRIKKLYGGTAISEDLRSLRTNKPHIVIGTVGRVLDMIQRKSLRINRLKTLVLDEADEMLNKGFQLQVRGLFNYISSETQVVLFSATFPKEMLELTKKFMKDPVRILVEKENLTLECITQYFVAMENDRMKYDTLKDLFSRISLNKCIIYCNTVTTVQILYNEMSRDGYSVCCIHSDMPKEERNEKYRMFSNGEERVLISSDITARGINVQQVSMVVNYELTPNVHTYLHRIGRSGRWGRKGWAINLITRRDVPTMKRIESFYNIDVKPLPNDFVQN